MAIFSSLITWNLSSFTRSTYNESMVLRTTKTTSRDVNEARRPHTCSRPCAFEEKQNRKKKNTKKSAPPKTHHEIHSSPASRHGRLIDQQEDMGNTKNTYSISFCLDSDMTIKVGTTYSSTYQIFKYIITEQSGGMQEVTGPFSVPTF